MIKNIYILIFAVTLGFSYNSFAKKQHHSSRIKRTKSTRPVRSSRSAKSVKTKSHRYGKSYFIFGPKAMLWQESIPAKRSGVGEELGSQFAGVGFGVTYRKPTSNIRWIQSHSMDISWGTLVAKSAGSTITDQLRNQMWYGITLSPGIGYRTSSASEVAFNVPLMYRKIDWQLSDPAFQMERASSFSYGIMGSFISQMSTQSSLQLSFTEQIAWKALFWSLGWNYRFL